MGERKYVILTDTENGKEYAVIFDRDLAHKAVAEGIMSAMRRTEWGPRMFLEPVAAGFVGDAARGSDSLGIGPRPQDQAIIAGTPVPATGISVGGKPHEPPRRSMLDRARGARAR